MKQEPPELAIISLLVQPNVPAEVAVRTIELIKNLGYTDLSVSIPHGIADPPNPANVEPPLPAIQARAKKLVPDTTSVYELNAARDRAIKSAIRACPAMTELFEKLVILTPEMRVDFLQEYTGRFWLECGCRADIELFTMLSSALMWELEEEPATTSLRLGPDPTPLPYALDQTWADLFPHIARRHPNAISFTPR
jgi:hypothetical protein